MLKRNYSILCLTPDEMEYLYYLVKCDAQIIEQVMGEFEHSHQYDLLDNAERHYRINQEILKRLE